MVRQCVICARENGCIPIAWPLDAAVDILRRTRTLEVVQGAFIGDWGLYGRDRPAAYPCSRPGGGHAGVSDFLAQDCPRSACLCGARGEAPEKVVINFLKTPDGKARFREETVAVVRQYPEVSFVSGGVGNIEIIHKSSRQGQRSAEAGGSCWLGPYGDHGGGRQRKRFGYD